MADVWISRKKWTCKYCDVTINDDLPSRRHHESGVRHKQNKEKALQELYRKGEQERKDAEQTRKEMERIEALAAESYAKDQAGGQQPGAAAPTSSTSRSTAPVSPSTSASTSKAKPASIPARHHTRPSTTPKVEAPQAVAQAGEWEQVEPAYPAYHTSSASTSSAVEPTDRDRARSFRMKAKVTRLDDSDDESEPVIRTKKKPRTVLTTDEDPSGMLPNAIGVKKEEQGPGFDAVKSEPNATDTAEALVKQEDEADEAKAKFATPEEADAGGGGGGGGLFKKRRAGAGAGAKRVRAVI